MRMPPKETKRWVLLSISYARARNSCGCSEITMPVPPPQPRSDKNKNKSKNKHKNKRKRKSARRKLKNARVKQTKKTKFDAMLRQLTDVMESTSEFPTQHSREYMILNDTCEVWVVPILQKLINAGWRDFTRPCQDSDFLTLCLTFNFAQCAQLMLPFVDPQILVAPVIIGERRTTRLIEACGGGPWHFRETRPCIDTPPGATARLVWARVPEDADITVVDDSGVDCLGALIHEHCCKHADRDEMHAVGLEMIARMPLTSLCVRDASLDNKWSRGTPAGMCYAMSNGCDVFGRAILNKLKSAHDPATATLCVANIRRGILNGALFGRANSNVLVDWAVEHLFKSGIVELDEELIRDLLTRLVNWPTWTQRPKPLVAEQYLMDYAAKQNISITTG